MRGGGAAPGRGTRAQGRGFRGGVCFVAGGAVGCGCCCLPAATSLSNPSSVHLEGAFLGYYCVCRLLFKVGRLLIVTNPSTALKVCCPEAKCTEASAEGADRAVTVINCHVFGAISSVVVLVVSLLLVVVLVVNSIISPEAHLSTTNPSTCPESVFCFVLFLSFLISTMPRAEFCSEVRVVCIPFKFSTILELLLQLLFPILPAQCPTCLQAFFDSRLLDLGGAFRHWDFTLGELSGTGTSFQGSFQP